MAMGAIEIDDTLLLSRSHKSLSKSFIVEIILPSILPWVCFETLYLTDFTPQAQRLLDLCW